MPELLAEVFRGKIAESRHYGHVAVCDSSGQLLAWAGEPDTVTYIRSAAKPIQALDVALLRGRMRSTGSPTRSWP